MSRECISFAAMICQWQGDLSIGFKTGKIFVNEVHIFLAQILKTWIAEDDLSTGSVVLLY